MLMGRHKSTYRVRRKGAIWISLPRDRLEPCPDFAAKRRKKHKRDIKKTHTPS